MTDYKEISKSGYRSLHGKEDDDLLYTCYAALIRLPGLYRSKGTSAESLFKFTKQQPLLAAHERQR